MRNIKLKFKVLFTIIILVIIVFFVRIQKVEVINNQNHTSEYIESLVFPNNISRITLYSYIKNKISRGKYNAPNIKKIDMKIINPFCVLLDVVEKPIIGYVRYKDDFYYFDEDMYLVNIKDIKDKTYMEIAGIYVPKSDVNTYLKIDNENASYIIKKIGQYSNVISMPIDNIDFTNPNAIQIVGNNLYVDIGDGSNIEEKISLIMDIYPKLEGMSGTLDLSKVKSGGDNGEYIFKKH